MKAWEWDTTHFNATVRSDGERFFYLLLDRTQGIERSIASGDALRFEEAEELLKESIGKTYPTRLGYQVYTGAAGTSFRIYTGEMLDFQDFDGSVVEIEAIGKNEKVHLFSGTLRLAGYEVFLYPDSKTKIKIPPSFIYKIHKSDGRARPAVTAGKTTRDITAGSKSEISRTVQGRFTVGCTGMEGFKAGTVSHLPDSPYCPIHNV